MAIPSIIRKCKEYSTPVVWLLALIVVAALLLGYERYVLWKIQEQNLFLDTPLFFRQQMVAPGGLLTYVGSFLMQLLYYPVVGVAVLCVWWYLLMELMRRTFRVGKPWTLLLLVPVALLLAANVQMGYWIYPIKLKGWYFDATVGVTVIVALLWAYRALSAHRLWRRLLLVVTVVAGYPLMGTYALAAVLLMALWCWRLDRDRWQAAADSFLAVLLVVAVPLLYYQYVYYQTNKVNLWWTALPVFKILEENTELYIPYVLIAVCLVLLVLGNWQSYDADVQVETVSRKEKKNRKSVKGKKSFKLPKGSWRYAVVTVVLAVTAYGVWKAWMKDENFHREVAMEYFVEQTRWEDVLTEAAKQQDPPTRSVVMMRNLALSRLGRQSTEMYRYRNGAATPAAPFPIPASMLVGNMIYYHYGMMNDCHHMCIEGGVEFGWRVEHLKYMVRRALMTGETNAMYKYTELLKHTLFHGEWARKMEKLQQQPELLRADNETGPILRMMRYPDMVDADHGYTERYVMGHLSRMDSNDPYFQEQCLLASLWTKDSSAFWRCFARYLSLHPGKPIPRYYQEAAWVFTYNDGKAPFEAPVDDDVKTRFDQFATMLERYDGKDINQARAALYPLYGDTYFYEYFLTEDFIYM
jgi:hypothetical protein